jgi:Single-strand binding protein family
VRGIQCAFTGTLGQDAELKTSKSGKPWLSVSVAVDMEASEEATTWVRVAVFGEMATRLYPELKKGTEVYCEGRLKLDSWTGRDMAGNAVVYQWQGAGLRCWGELVLTPPSGSQNRSSPQWHNPSSRDKAVPSRTCHSRPSGRLRPVGSSGATLLLLDRSEEHRDGL